MLSAIALVLLISGVLIIANAGVLYLLVVIASAFWLGTGPAVLALLIATVGIAYFYAPLDADLAVTVTRLVVILAAFLVGVALARVARREESRADAERLRFQMVVEHAPAGIAVLSGPDFVFELVNPAYQALAPGKTFLGKTVAEAWPELAGEVLPLLDRVFRSGESYHAAEARLPVQRAPGAAISDAYFTFSYVPIGGRRGERAILVLVVEITERVLARKRIEDQRERAEQLAAEAEELAAERKEHVERLQELDRLKDDFLSTAAHELKTPVAIMKGYAQALLGPREQISERQRKMLEAIDRGSNRIDGIVVDLLDISKLQSGHLELELGRIDLGSLIAEVSDRMALTAPKHHLRLVSAKRAFVQADRGRLEQVVVNLVDNAIKYSPGGGDIDLSVAVLKRQAIVSVTDRGVGVPREKQGRIFQRFYRAHTKTPYEYGGIGLGLYISREIVERHGGRMWFQSEEGKGSTFSFSLPLK